MTATGNTAVVLRFFERFAAGDAQAALTLLDEQAVWWVSGKPDQYPSAGPHGKDEVLQMLGRVGQARPNGVEIEVTYTTAQDDRVVAEVASRGVSAAGKVYDQRLVFVFQLRDSRIHRIREYLDTLHANDVLVAS
ncbi:nuclear transport factor 2 family protein [Streptomyces phyllanthi]|uniref:Nuclear transport factor 2 family protein n=1 Tax=Streptomyces phyllanthi TaxID=1803180 RepID=A0A5N8W8N5_9ACTN|nr:nuclear transport factor 2 family protein [Streptomyces phyllanthi]MPY43837.1 nuclear transport factor 2 family protein [Streptomyces phyllanthi]